MNQLAEAYLRDYRVMKRKSSQIAEWRWSKHLKPFFGHLRAVQVDTDLINKYIDSRQSDGAEDATINRELSAIKRMFTLGIRGKKVLGTPYVPRLAERNVRKGFVEDEQFARLAEACAEVGLWMRCLLECGYTYGWRSGELKSLRCAQVDLVGGTIRLNAGETKNDAARVVKMTAAVRVLLTALCAGKGQEEFVFTRDDKSIVKSFRGTWTAVNEKAGTDILFHDLRRSAVRNMVRGGISENVAMGISGHKTRAVFDRYNIVSERDLDDAVTKLEARRPTVTKPVTSEEEATQIASSLPN
jgi:integrase